MWTSSGYLTSGLYGPLTSSIFCGRKCLRSYYDNQPGVWEQEEIDAEYYLEQDRLLQESIRESEEKFKLEEQVRLHKLESDRIKKQKTYIMFFFILLILSFILSNVWMWLIFTSYCLFLIKRWCNN
jgi:nitrogen fixation/metabolism regulation signal transduction histidine kinase